MHGAFVAPPRPTLPPTPAEAAVFLDDPRPDAYKRLVNRLLASPHYSERWVRPWLDVARYADSNGYSNDAPRQIWKYRDWVVAALNRDLPFDQFVVEQLAGDLPPHPTHAPRIATGFNRHPHATLLHALGLDHTQLTFRFQGRDFRLTDVHGKVISKLKLFA